MDNKNNDIYCGFYNYKSNMCQEWKILIAWISSKKKIKVIHDSATQ